MADDDDDDSRPLTPAERRKFRDLMRREERVAWFWSSARVWAAWAAAGTTACYGLYQAFRDMGVFKKIGGL
jgi:hypothetical protein